MMTRMFANKQLRLLCDLGRKLLPVAPLPLVAGVFVLSSGSVLTRRGADGSERAE